MGKYEAVMDCQWGGGKAPQHWLFHGLYMVIVGANFVLRDFQVHFLYLGGF